MAAAMGRLDSGKGGVWGNPCIARALRDTLDYVPPEEPSGTPLGNAIRIR